jgi:hypothetical protein
VLLGDLLTVVREKVPTNIVVFNNGKLGFIDIEQRSAGLIPMYKNLKNPDFGEVAKAMGLWGHGVPKGGDPETIKTWLAQPSESDAASDAALALWSPEAVIGMGSIAPKQCCKTKAATSGKWWRRIFEMSGACLLT